MCMKQCLLQKDWSHFQMGRVLCGSTYFRFIANSLGKIEDKKKGHVIPSPSLARGICLIF